MLSFLQVKSFTDIPQFIWFLAPTVSLCAQQFDYLQSQITSVPMKYLSGADGVDRWTEQSLWNAVLHGCKVVVSTYQILLDALTHAFVKMESLALIVFDEGLSLSRSTKRNRRLATSC